MLTGTEQRWKSKLQLSPRGNSEIFDASVRKVILNFSLQFDKSTFSLNAVSRGEAGQRGRW